MSLQAAFFVLLPVLGGTQTAASAFVATSLTAFLNPVLAFGSQFHAVRGAATSVGLGRALPSGAVGALLAGGAGILAAYLYGPTLFAVAPAFVGLYVLANYARAFVDAVAQGMGRYNWTQGAYVGFWVAKVLLILLIANSSDLGFGHIVALEVVCSSPWLVALFVISVRNASAIEWRFDLGDDLTITAATLARMAWLEGDKLLLPAVVSTATYVDYSLAVRSATAGIALVSAWLGVATPRIVRGSPAIIGTLLREGRSPAALATVVTVTGSVVVLLVYPNLGPEEWLVMAIAAAFVWLYFVSHVYADYVFYHLGAAGRLKANIVGTLCVLLGILFVGLGTWSVAFGTALSYAVVQWYSARLARVV